ncbi:putative isoaspartyl peptidase/L-asparaginase GA20639 [Glossina fuscipes fuscipes]
MATKHYLVFLLLDYIFTIGQTIQIVPTVLVHGGAGKIAEDAIPAKLGGVKMAAHIGYETLLSTGDVVSAVEEAVRSMEANGAFNAGYGSVLNWEGNIQMDAAIMNGSDLNAGCVSLITDILHPISLARCVMEKTRHTYLAGCDAMIFAAESNFTLLPEGALITNESKQALEDYKNSINGGITEFDGISIENELTETFGSPGTVGAVAIDANGNVAAATSTGGLTGKMPGRIGDSPILGGGTYADNAAGSVSATGHGESIMRFNVASRILALVKYKGLTAPEATSKVLDEMRERFNQTAGVISIDHQGNLGIYFTSQHMPWAYQSNNGLHYGVTKNIITMEEIEVN